MTVAQPLNPLAAGARARRYWLGFLRLQRSGKFSLFGLILLVLFSLMASPLASFLGTDPSATDLLSRYEPSSIEHWLGTDEAGRDELVRLMLGGQTSLFVGFATTSLAAALGLSIGLASGYWGGTLDTLLMRLTDGIIALPLLPLVIILGAVDLTKLGFSNTFAQSPTASLLRSIVIIALVEWTTLARVTRASTLSLKQRDFVTAAAAIGAAPLHIIKKHVLPNIAGPTSVAISLTLGRVILFESVLSFLGFGIVPPTPSWGNMLTDAQDLVTVAPALAVYPGLMIFLTVALVNLAGDSLRNTLDPRGKHKNQ
jgi:peptide/nickel transport system permease protein